MMMQLLPRACKGELFGLGQAWRLGAYDYCMKIARLEEHFAFSILEIFEVLMERVNTWAG